MDKKLEQLHITRIRRFYNKISASIIYDETAFDLSIAKVEKPVFFPDSKNLDYNSISEGDSWGKQWELAWFHLEGDIPQEWKGEKVVARLDFGGEGLVLDKNGVLLQGISNGSVFQEEFARDIVPLFDNTGGGEKVELWIEATASGLFGIHKEVDPDEKATDRYGKYEAVIKSARISVFNEEIWALWLDLQILSGLINTLPEKSVRRAKLIRCVTEAIDIYYKKGNDVTGCREKLAEELSKPAAASDLEVTAVGHAHIDTAWLWPVDETIRKCARTFSSQCSLLESYPDYVFGASQPQHYAFVKEHYPVLYDEIKKLVKTGRWEVQGGMWVEADCNLISGESLVRQVLHGKNFFQDEFGIDVHNLWLPDVFGYSAALPQILRKSGIKYFLTQKLSWNQFNDFPHHTFNWTGIDGSEVLVHFPPENTYNSQLNTQYLVPGRDNFKEKDFLDEFICLFGVGDGGGGPKAENIETGKRMADLEGAPKVKFGTAKEFFSRLSQHKDKLATWNGELYFELHRGTLTSQATVKKGNRKLEHRLRALEMLSSLLTVEKYPSEKLDTVWKTVLRNQFHDIIPGSSITEVYKTTLEEYAWCNDECKILEHQAAGKLFRKDDNSLVCLNSLSFEYSGTVRLPSSWKDYEVKDSSGKELLIQSDGDFQYTKVEVPSLSFITLKKGEKLTDDKKPNNDLVLENELVRYVFNENGRLIEAFDFVTNRNIIKENEPGNVLTLYSDFPNDWDAWDIDLFYENCAVEEAKRLEWSPLGKGDVFQGLSFRYQVGSSSIKQKVFLPNGSKELRFETNVDWKEKHKMLRVSFPVNIKTDREAFDIQYGYVYRPTHRNTSWDWARFEAAGQKYADLSDEDYGVALMNDSKYGYRLKDNLLDLNLLRSPTYPDPDADTGSHQFVYSLYPHENSLAHSDVFHKAAALNQGLLVLEGFAAKDSKLPWSIEGDGISLEVVKKAEKENVLILRVVEIRGRNSRGKLTIDLDNVEIIETDLMEHSVDGQCSNPALLSLSPFEIKTFKIKGIK